MPRALVLLLLMSLSPLAASGQEALDVDISGEFGPVRNQRDIGWCYANAAADMLTWKYGVREHPVSASHIALLRNELVPWETPDAESGLVAAAMLAYSNRPGGMCKAEALEDVVFSRLGYRRYEEVFGALRRLRSELASISASRDREEARTLARRLLARLEDAGSRIEPNAAFIDFLASAGEPPEERAVEIAEWLAHELCARGGYLRQNRGLFPHDIDADFAAHAQARAEELARSLGREIEHLDIPDARLRRFASTLRSELAERQPVAITYSAGFLDSEERAASGRFDYRDLHSSVVVGARCARDRPCVFKVRNSWGPSCTVTRGGRPAPLYQNPAIQRTCEGGHFWMTAEQVEAFTSNIVRFGN